MKTRISWLLLPFGIGLCFVSAMLYAAVPSQAMAPSVPFIMLYGERSLIDSTTAPYISSGGLKYLREYPLPDDYLHEGGLTIPPGTIDLGIHMFEVTTPTIGVQSVVSQVISSTLPQPALSYVYPHFEFMSYMPKEIMIHGLCPDVNGPGSLSASFDPDVNLESLIVMDYVGVPPAATECVGLYSITNPTKRVTDFTNGQMVGTARAEPNFITTGMMGAYGIFGSPAAMLAGAPPTSTSGTSPLATTGLGVDVYVFDTSPYQSAVPFFTATIATTDIKVAHLPKVRLPLNRLPFNPNRSVGAHGTFVTTPIVDIAPDSNIHLARILNEDGFGTQFDFVVAVDWAVGQATGVANDLSGVVFNYSLGLEDESGDQSKTAMNRIISLVAAQNIVQVAATGNDSAYESMPKPMDLPAKHPAVIGVTAIVPGNLLACYANETDATGVAARGGGAPRGVADCNVDQFVYDCKFNGQVGCLHGWDPNSPTSYAYGIGTSFASPHVAGFAAQVIQLLAPPRRDSSWVKPVDVLAIIHTKAIGGTPEMGRGIVGNWPMPTPLAVGLEQFSAETIAPLTLFTGLLLIAVSGTLAWHRYRKNGYNSRQ